MPAKSRFSLPRLKLRGTIILAAAAVFTLAIVASLFYVVSSNREQDLQQADEVVGQLAVTESQKIASFLSVYATASQSLATTGTALLADPATTPATYNNVVSNQLQSLPAALGTLMM